MEKEGRFIVVDGVDGSGKSTLIQNLAKLIKERHGRTVRLTREPGGSVFAEELRKMVLDPVRAKTLTPDTVFMLMGAGRFDHLRTEIAPALARGEVVICDRYDSSTHAYQIRAEGHPELKEVLTALQRAWALIARPSMYLLVDVSPETARVRLAGRKEKLNHFDLKDPEFHAQVRAGMQEFSNMVAPCHIVSGEPSPAEVTEKAYSLIEALL